MARKTAAEKAKTIYKNIASDEAKERASEISSASAKDITAADDARNIYVDVWNSRIRERENEQKQRQARLDALYAAHKERVDQRNQRASAQMQSAIASGKLRAAGSTTHETSTGRTAGGTSGSFDIPIKARSAEEYSAKISDYEARAQNVEDAITDSINKMKSLEWGSDEYTQESERLEGLLRSRETVAAQRQKYEDAQAPELTKQEQVADLQAQLDALDKQNTDAINAAFYGPDTGTRDLALLTVAKARSQRAKIEQRRNLLQMEIAVEEIPDDDIKKFDQLVEYNEQLSQQGQSEYFGSDKQHAELSYNAGTLENELLNKYGRDVFNSAIVLRKREYTAQREKAMQEELKKADAAALAGMIAFNRVAQVGSILDIPAVLEARVNNIPVDVNAMSVTNMRQDIDAEAMSRMTPGFAKVYSFAMSVADNVARMAMAASTGSVTAGKLYSLGVTGVSVGASTIKDATERGIDSDAAIASGAMAAFFEIFFESEGIEALLQPKAILSDYAKAVFKEAAQEGLTGVFQSAADILQNGELSEYRLNVAAYRRQGYSQTEAEHLAIWDLSKQLALETIEGGLSGGILEGLQIAINRTYSGQNFTTENDNTNGRPTDVRFPELDACETEADVHKALREFAKTNHPDMGGDATAMAELSNAAARLITYFRTNNTQGTNTGAKNTNSETQAAPAEQAGEAAASVEYAPADITNTATDSFETSLNKGTAAESPDTSEVETAAPEERTRFRTVEEAEAALNELGDQLDAVVDPTTPEAKALERRYLELEDQVRKFIENSNDLGERNYAQESPKADENSQTALVNRTMTMSDAKRMIEMAFNLNDIKEWYDGKYKTADEWLADVGASEVAMYAENTENIIEQYHNRIPELVNHDVTEEEILEAYQAGTLTGKVKASAPARQIDLSQSTGRTDSRFYAPKAVKATADTWTKANERVTNANRAHVQRARTDVLFAAHSEGIDNLGISSKELNTKLRSWSAYPVAAKNASARINQGVATENRWTGIENSSILSQMNMTDDDIRGMVKSIDGESTQHQRNYIGNTMLAIDTHVDWSWLSFVFENRGYLQGNTDSGKALGYYENGKREIHVGTRGYLNTVAHEMGHALDYQWSRELLGNKPGNGLPFSELSVSADTFEDPDARTFYKHFRSFMVGLENAADIRSSYTSRGTETFARFVARFVEWTNETAGGHVFSETSHYKDRFTTGQFVEFARLLQEKAKIDMARAEVVEKSASTKTSESSDIRFSRDARGNVIDDNFSVEKRDRILQDVYDGKGKGQGVAFTVLQHTPQVFLDYVDPQDRSLVTTEGKAKQAMQGFNKKQHGLGVDGYKETLNQLHDPDYIILQLSGANAGHYVAIVELKGKETVVAVDMGNYRDKASAINGEDGYYNVVVTAFTPDNDSYIDGLFGSDVEIIYDKAADAKKEVSNHVALSEPLSGLDSRTSTKTISPEEANGNTVEQKISSARTSIKQIPALFTNRNVEFGGTNIDIGGGRFDLATNYLAEQGTENMIFDPYNRDEAANRKVIDFLQRGQKADTATCANVLNVIAEAPARANVILEAAKSIKDDGRAYFMVYEGDGSGEGRETSSGYQNNRKTASYVPEIGQYFNSVTRKGKLIIAEKPKSDLPKASWEIQPGQAVLYSLDSSEETSTEKSAIERYEEVEAWYAEAQKEYYGIAKQAQEIYASEQYNNLFNAVTEAKTPEDMRSAVDAFNNWAESSEEGRTVSRFEALRKDFNSLRREMQRAEREALAEAKELYRKQFGPEFNSKYVSKAERKFGTTRNYDKAAYLDTNGKLLDFSEGQGYRVQDHRAIAEILDFLPDYHEHSDGLIEFMNMGNIRMQSYGIDVSTEPNAKQYAELRRFFEHLDGEVTVDFSDENGNTVGSIDYPDGTRPDAIINGMKRYFSTGEVPKLTTSQMFREPGAKYGDFEGQMSLTDFREFYEDNYADAPKENIRIAAEESKGLIDRIQRFQQNAKNAGDDVSANARTVALGITSEFVQKGYIDFSGLKLNEDSSKAAAQIASYAMILRNPNFETFRILYTKGDQVVANTAVTCYNVDSTYAVLDMDQATSDKMVKDQMKRLGADGYYLMHNHPSGDVHYSEADELTTKRYRNHIPGLRGHIIIDHNKYGFFDRNLYFSTNDIENGEARDYNQRVIDSPLLYKTIGGPEDVADISQNVVHNKDVSTILYVNKNGVRAVQEVNNNFVLSKDFKNYVENRKVDFGSSMVFFVGNLKMWNAIDEAGLYRRGVFTDVVADGIDDPYFGKSYVSMKELREFPRFAYGSDSKLVRVYDSISRNDYSGESNNADDAVLLKQTLKDARTKIDALRKQRDYWKAQTKTSTPSVTQASANRMASAWIEQTGSTMKKSEVAAKIKDLGDWLRSGSDDISILEARKRARAVARELIDSARILANDAEMETFADIKKSLKQEMMISPADASNIPDFEDWRRHHFGQINVRRGTGGFMIDQAYQELSGMYPEYFPEDIAHPADQLLRMADVYGSMQPIYENPFDSDYDEALNYAETALLEDALGLQTTAPTYADRKEAEIARLKQISADRLQTVRQQRDQQIQALKDHYRQVAEDKRARKADASARTRLLKIAKRLHNKKLPAVTRARIDAYIGDLDLIAKSMTGATEMKLSSLKEWYEDQKRNNPDFIPNATIEAKLDRLNKRQIADLSQEEVADLTDILLNIENEIRTQDKFIKSEIARNTYAAGQQVIADIENTRGPSKADPLVTGLLTPEREIRRVTGYREDDPLYVATRELSQGANRQAAYQNDAENKFSEWTKDKKFMRTFAGPKATEISLAIIGRPDIKITPAMRASLHLHSRNADNARHMADGGVTIPDMDAYKKGDTEAAYDRGTVIKLTPSQVKAITSEMTAKERAYAAAVSRYFNETSRNAINEVSEAKDGFSIAGVENYFPIDTNKAFLKTEFDAIKRDGTIEGMGFTKERVHASNPIMLYDMDTVLNRSIQQHAKYVGLAIPVRNFNKLWNVGSWNDDEPSSVQNALRKTWGRNAYAYIEKMMADLQNPKINSDGISAMLGKVRSNFAGGVLGLNASVAIKQSASYPTAAAVLGWNPLMKAMGDVGKVDLDIVHKYSPMQAYREKGFANQELGEIVTRKGHTPTILNWIQGMDVMTTRKLWKASEYYVRDNFKNLEVGSEAYYRKVGEIHTQVLEETQPNYTVMQRPQLLRSDSDLTKTLVMFKTQPFQNFNILYDATEDLKATYRAYRNGGNKSAYQRASKAFGRAVTSQLAASFIFALMQYAWDVFRKKDEKYKDGDEKTITSWTKGIGINMLTNGFGMFPFGGEIFELIEESIDKALERYGADAFFNAKVYGLSDSIVEHLNDAADAVRDLRDVMLTIGSEDWDPLDSFITVKDIAVDLATFAGVPAGNVRNLFRAAQDNVFDVTSDYEQQYRTMKLRMSQSENKKAFIDILWNARESGDQEAYDNIYEDLIKEDRLATSTQTTEEYIKAQIKKREQEKTANSSSFSEKRSSAIEAVESTRGWTNLSEDQQSKILREITAWAMDTGSTAGAEYVVRNQPVPEGLRDTEAGKIIEGSASLTAEDYFTYRVALFLADRPTESGKTGTFNQAEIMYALQKASLTDEERRYIWSYYGYKTDYDEYLRSQKYKGWLAGQ